MQVFRKLEDIPASFGPALLSVGNFDGVHRAQSNGGYFRAASRTDIEA
jgi:hypothetical protein